MRRRSLNLLQTKKSWYFCLIKECDFWRKAMSGTLTNRRNFMQTLGIGAASLSMPFAARANAERKPNVLLIMTDDQGWGDIHSHGNET
ncbi:twin-arginine translocation signal domain-containing protein, partial [bacterium]|nr:twin-arginine translocation signal domain-containing protein [bacterium]